MMKHVPQLMAACSRAVAARNANCLSAERQSDSHVLKYNFNSEEGVYVCTGHVDNLDGPLKVIVS
jgi:hypothetical protein